LLMLFPSMSGYHGASLRSKSSNAYARRIPAYQIYMTFHMPFPCPFSILST
jgi:hypothetical protein